ncbi:DnaD domain-containing protein [Clostridium cadaveris]|uniref:DnaD domain-containing protein n=1 Tax=Clostridium cadaveris TaxID=1529 RepID=UPI0015B5BB64|nr:DnaD domain protein [Clostridium cadaveris]NWK12495.1 DnaD domain protein [Clostridium cadaveris]
MAEKRMFSKSIIDSDEFLDMPLSAQALYFHLSMRADDDGFINGPARIQRTIGCSPDDFKLLLVKRFLIQFETGVVVIKHWRIHNYIAKDRYHETMYIEEKERLFVDANKAYSLEPTSQKLFKNKVINLQNNNDTSLYPSCIQNVYNLDTQISIDKNRLDKSSIDKNSIESDADNVTVDNYIDFFNNNFHLITQYEFETLNSYLEDGITEEAILLALKKALDNGARNIKYVKKILDTWLTNNIKTVEDVNAADAEFKRNKTTKEKTIVIKKESTFNNCSQRDYSSDQIDSLERKLLGWEEYTDER